MKLVVIRHGESVWNKENIFTGWVDVPLSENGINQAKKAKELLKDYSFDLAYTSYLRRASDTLNIILEGLNVPIKKAWQLNERFYGDLQGKNKEDVKKQYGEEQFMLWRRSYDVRPLKINVNSEFYQGNDEKYKGISVPLTESLKDTEARVLPYLQEEIFPKIKQGKKIIISAHGNSIRAMVKILENISGEKIAKVEIPLAIPLIYELDENLKVLKKYYLE